ncbi:MAG: cohesin domain-containing protein [Candidatus Zixiibacteriota bacterium]
MIQFRRHIILASLIILGVAGCHGQSTAPRPTTLVKMGFTLSENDLASLVDSVTLTIVYSDSTREESTLRLIDGEIIDTLEVHPDGEVRFTLRAFRSNGTLLYEGTTIAAVPVGQQVQVDILLEPAPGLSMLRVGPLLETVPFADSDPIEVFVDIHRVTSLYGASFRLAYDPDILEYVNARSGPFLAEGGVELLAGTFPVTDGPGQLGFAVTRIQPPEETKTGVSGSGRIVRFIFRAVAAGETDVLIITTDGYRPRLNDPGGEPVPEQFIIVLESATVRVTAP